MTVVELELLILRPTLSIVSNDLLSFLGSAYPFNLQFLYLLALFPPGLCHVIYYHHVIKSVPLRGE